MENGISEILSALCMECWHFISTFHNFQQTIFLVQQKLIKDSENLSNISQQQEEFLRRKSLDVPNINLNIKVEEEFISLNETQNENEENLQYECTEENISMEPESDSNEMEEEFEDPVGVFRGGEFNDADDQYSDISFSDLADIDVRFSSDDEDDFKMCENNPKEKSGSNLGTIEEKSPQTADTDVRFSSDGKTDPQMFENNQKEPDSCSGTIAEKSPQPADIYSKQKKSSEELDLTISYWKPTLECGLCSDKFKTFTNLIKHYRCKHPSAEFRISCCGRKFKNRRSFAEHAQLHMNPNAFQCSHCRKCCSSKSNLVKHILAMHGQIFESKSDVANLDYRHKCPMCNKAYKVPSTLREHLCTHTGELSRKCKFCNKAYKYRSSLNYHLKTVHADKISEKDHDNNTIKITTS